MITIVICVAVIVSGLLFLADQARRYLRRQARRGSHAKGAPRRASVEELRFKRFLPDPPVQATGRADGGIPEFAPARIR